MKTTTSPDPQDRLLDALKAHPVWHHIQSHARESAALELRVVRQVPRRPSPGTLVLDLQADGVVVGWLTARGARAALSVSQNAHAQHAAATLSAVGGLLRSAGEQARLIEEQRAIVDHIADGLLVLGPGAVIRHINRTAARLLHLNPAKAIGKPLGALVDFRTVVESVFTTGQGYVDRELIIDSPSLNLHVVDTAVPIRDAQGHVVSVVNTVREIQRVRHLAQRISGSHARYRFEDIIGRSPALQQAVSDARKAARSSANVLLSGESGVGKEVFAQAIHNASPRREGAFIAINCAALPRDLIESELFGYVAGSFTGARREGRPGKFEAASGGTIFLDEIAELPLDVQAKLLRVLQEREVVRVGDTRGVPVDVRVITASNRDLRRMVDERLFREDLYYRCRVIEVALPPLRQRAQDIPLLAHHFLAKYAGLLDKPVFGFTEAALQALQAHDWPGNVRELENAIERAVNLSEQAEIDVPVLDLPRRHPTPPGAGADGGTGAQPLTLAEAEHAAIEAAIRHAGYNLTQASRLLGISKPTIYAKIRRYGIALERPLPGAAR